LVGVILLAALAVSAALPFQDLTTATARRRGPMVATERAPRSASVVGTGGFEHLAMPRLPLPGSPATGAVPIIPPTTFEGAPPALVAPPRALAAPATVGPANGTGTWAVLVGIDDYPGTRHDLTAAKNDVASVKAALTALGTPEDHLLVIEDGQARIDVVRAGIEWLNAHAGPDSVAVFFFAGHVRKVGPDREALATAEGRAITDEELANRFTRLSARRAWIGIAGCYGGGFTEVMAPGRVLTGAAPANEVAYESSAFGRSYMVEYMIQQAMVEGRAPQTVQTAFAYAADALARDYPGRQPVQVDKSDGSLALGTQPQPTASSSPPAEGSQPSPPPPSAGGPPPSSPPTTAPPPPQKHCLLGVVC
jgi:hypothetical protein